VRIGLVIRPREGNWSHEALRSLVASMREAGHDVWPRLTFEAGDACRQARWMARRGADRIVAVGGDGTLNEVVNGVLGLEWSGAVGVVPQGTANDFAAGLGIPEELEAALSVALDGTERRVDVGRVNGRYFVNVSTGGFGAEAAEEAPAEAKRLLGPWAYVVTGVRKFVELRPSRARFSAPGGVLYEGEMLLFAVGNGKQTGGGNRLTPRALLDDGKLDVMIVPAMPRMEFLSLIPELRSGTHLDDPAIRYYRTPRLRVEAEAPLSVNADGEPLRGLRFSYRVAARSRTLMVPEQMKTPAGAEPAGASK
jgi:diacylglycerol kinase (ATP)